MDIRITPAALSGKVRAISSKSHAHRLLLATAISELQIIQNNASTDSESHCSHEQSLHQHHSDAYNCGHHHSHEHNCDQHHPESHCYEHHHSEEHCCENHNSEEHSCGHHHSHDHHSHACSHGCSTSPLEQSLIKMRDFQQSVLNKVQIDDWNEDLEATKNCIFQLMKDNPVFDCNESGSTLRFMLPVAMALKSHAMFCGAGRLPDRPISPLREEMESKGCHFIVPQEHFQGANSQQTITDNQVERNRTEAMSSSSKVSRLIAIVDGKLQSGHFKLPGNVSSQYITGLLFALPLLDGDSVLEITSPLESSGYVDLTLDVLKQFGVEIATSEPASQIGDMCVCTPNSPSQLGHVCESRLKQPVYHIRGNQTYCLCCHGSQESQSGLHHESPAVLHAEGDWSNAAFWIVADLLSSIRFMNSDSNSNSSSQETLDFTSSSNSEATSKFSSESELKIIHNPDYSHISSMIICDNLNSKSSQGDKQIIEFVDIIRKNIKTNTSLTFDVSQVPDLVPILAVLACIREHGTTNIVNAGRLRIKESDRLATVREMLETLGANITESEDSLIIRGYKESSANKAHQKTVTQSAPLKGGTVNGYNDHRIVMAAAIASIMCAKPVTIIGAEAVNKSYPNFWWDFAKLGGEFHEL